MHSITENENKPRDCAVRTGNHILNSSAIDWKDTLVWGMLLLDHPIVGRTNKVWLLLLFSFLIINYSVGGEILFRPPRCGYNNSKIGPKVRLIF